MFEARKRSESKFDDPPAGRAAAVGDKPYPAGSVLRLLDHLR